MDFLSSFFDSVGQVFDIVISLTSTKLLSAVGLILLLLTAVLAYVAIKSTPQQLSWLVIVALFASLIGGMAFSAAGPGLALLYISQTAITRMSGKTALKHLEENTRVNYLIRLISFDPREHPEFTIDRLSKLGPAEQLYSFVASYDELAGYTVQEALEKVGQTYTNGNRASAIIFPRQTAIYPANARGLLQVIKAIEGRTNMAPLTNRFFQGSNSLNNDEIEDLGSTDISSYKVDNFKNEYRHYCELARRFKCDVSYSARAYVGGLARDWHPLGFSQKNPPNNPCAIPVENYCEFVNWKKVEDDFDKDFGSRVFLMTNLEIKDIPGRIVVDFDNPNSQLIPEIGAR